MIGSSARPAAVPSWRSWPSTRITARSAMASAAFTFCSTRTMVTPWPLISFSCAKNLGDDLRRQAGRRLVEDQHRRLDDQRARHRQHLPLAARQRAGAPRRPLGEIGEHGVEIGDAPARACPSAGCRPRRSRLSWIDSVAKMFSVCGTKARPCRIFSCAGTAVMSTSPSDIVPEWTGTSPAIALTKVDLPAPFGPEHDDQFAGAHREIDAAHDRQVALVAGDERRCRKHDWPVRRPSRHSAEIGFDDGRVSRDLRRRAFGQKPAAGHDDDAAAEPRHHLHVVLDEQDRLAARVEVEHAVDDQFEQRRVDAGRRLVEQDRPRDRPSGCAPVRAACAGRPRARAPARLRAPTA